MWSAIGVPVVRPSKMPERMRTWSGSWRWVVKRDWTGRRLARKGWISASYRLSPGGQPSTTAPSAGPWLSPQVVNRKMRPKLLKLTPSHQRDIRRVLGLHSDNVIAGIDMVRLAGGA